MSSIGSFGDRTSVFMVYSWYMKIFELQYFYCIYGLQNFLYLPVLFHRPKFKRNCDRPPAFRDAPIVFCVLPMLFSGKAQLKGLVLVLQIVFVQNVPAVKGDVGSLRYVDPCESAGKMEIQGADSWWWAFRSGWYDDEDYLRDARLSLRYSLAASAKSNLNKS